MKTRIWMSITAITLFAALGIPLQLAAQERQKQVQAQNSLTITTPWLPWGPAGIPYSFTLTAAGGVPPYTWSAAFWPPDTNLKLSSGGTLYGRPWRAGTIHIAVHVRDSASPPQTASTVFTLYIMPFLMGVNSTPPPPSGTPDGPSGTPDTANADSGTSATVSVASRRHRNGRNKITRIASRQTAATIQIKRRII